MLLMLQIIGVGIFWFILRVILLGLISVLDMLLQLYLELQGLLRNGHEISPHFVSFIALRGFPETTQNREIIS